MSKLRCLDLFSGIGGFSLGLEQAGMSTAAFCEHNSQARDVLARHYPTVPIFEDVHHVNAATTQFLGRIDLICGGFPCQDVSVAGRRAGLAGKRSGLWFEFRRIIGDLKPAWVIIENVPGLLSSNGGRDFAVILQGLVECGYGVAWRVLDAQYFGVAQRRRRVFIVGHLGDGRAAQVLFERESDPGHLASIGEAEASVATPAAGRVGETISHALTASGSPRYDPDGETYVADTLTANYAKHPNSSTGPVNVVAFDYQAAGSERTTIARKNGKAQLIAHRTDAIYYSHDYNQDRVYSTEGIAPAVTVSDSNQARNIFDVQGVRRLTPRECERLQGFPDNWTAGQSDTARYRQLGNAVAVPVVHWLGRRIQAAEYQDF